MTKIKYILALLVAAVLFSASPALAQSDSDSAPETHNCGIKQLPVPDYITGVYNFKKACGWHDLCYRSSNPDTGKRYLRSWCDNRFYNKMKSSCKNSDFPRTCKVAAATYYSAVRGYLGIWSYQVLKPEVVPHKMN